MIQRLHSYVVRYDSGFAPNPFYGYCTLATCKPDIRKHSQIGDWVIGSGSADQKVRRGGYLVYAMRVTEVLSFDDYSKDDRFQKKVPFRNGSRKQSCGDNIYYRITGHPEWRQRDSFHSKNDGNQSIEHTKKDTRVNRILVSDDFFYFGVEGPLIPHHLQDGNGNWICKAGIGRQCFDDQRLITNFERWLHSFGPSGYKGAPHEWISLR